MKTFLQAFSATTVLFILFAAGGQVYAATAATTLSVTVNTALTFAVTTNNFSSINPGTAVMATTTLVVGTNDTAGYIVALSGDNKSTGNNNLQSTPSSVQISDQTEWVPGVATTSAGTGAAQISSLTNSNNVLAFRLAASSTNGTALTASSWWGSADNYLATNAATLYAGIASSTNGPRTIGNAGAGSYSASNHVNTVQYYLNVASTQQTGSYSAPLTYTATGN